MEKFKKSMQLKVMAILAICLIMVSIFSIALEVSRITQTANMNFDKRVNEMGRLFSLALAYPMQWESADNEPAVQSAVQAMFADANMLEVSVYIFKENKKRYFFSILRDEQGNPQFTQKQETRHYEDSISKEIPIFKLTTLSQSYIEHLIKTPFLKEMDHELTGVANVSYSTQYLIQERQMAIRNLSISTLLVFGVIFVALSFVLRQLVTLPLRQVSEGMTRVAEGSYDEALASRGEDEVGRMVKSFEKMRLAIRKKIHDLRALNTTSEKLANLRDHNEALRLSLEILEEQTQVEWGSIYLLDEGKNILQFNNCYPEVAEAKSAREIFNMGEGIAGKSAQEKRAIFVADTTKDNVFVQDAKLKATPRALLCVPMLDKTKLFGVMNFSGDTSKVTFEADDEEFAQTLARMTVVTTKNIQMVKLIEEHNRTLEQKVQERTEELRIKNVALGKEVELRKKAEARIQELLEAQHEIGDHLIQHALKNQEES
ncbi:GAF domain-containing protein [Deltaproteobacteria bacterium TL4]